MLIGNKLKDPDENSITYGTAADVCAVCAFKLAKEKKMGVRFAEKELAGELEMKKVFLVPTFSRRIVICSDCMKKAAAAL